MKKGPNKYKKIGDTIRIYLDKGKSCVIDFCDYESVKKYRWYCRKIGRKNYCCHSYYDGEKVYVIYLHRLINKTPKKLRTDHINGNGLDNRKSNLRSCTASQNNCNTMWGRKIKGIFYSKQRRRWYARINFNKKNYSLGGHKHREEAVLAYNNGAIKYHGEFARLIK